MGLAHDLLAQARRRAVYEGVDPSQAALRRSVSTAYHALFDLLVQDACRRWSGSRAAVVALERAFEHGTVKSTSLQFSRPEGTDWGSKATSVPDDLQRVARAFVDLQNERHTADYDGNRAWTLAEVQDVPRIAEGAFGDWSVVRSDGMAENYLVSMLRGKARR